MAEPERSSVDEPRLRVLGAVELDGSTVTPTQAIILSALALRNGSPVGRDSLLDAVWPTGAPDSARPSLQNQISRIRRRFGDEVVTTVRGGYRLGVRTDVEDFEELAALGCSTGSRAERVASLERARALWRGQPFEALFDHPDAAVEAARLTAVRQRVDQCLAEARIAAGDRLTALEELAALVEAEPYTEPNWELLIRALAMEGRGAEALAAYERMSEMLQRDLGSGPSARLRELRDRIADVEVRDCGGSLPMRSRARCPDGYTHQRTVGGDR